MTEDKLAEMLKLQKEFQIKTGFEPPLHDLASALMTEGGEVWAAAGGKWWKHYINEMAWGEFQAKGNVDDYLKKLESQNHEHLVEESIDVFHFLLCMWIRLGIDANEVFESYCSKMKVNLKRQDDKY